MRKAGLVVLFCLWAGSPTPCSAQDILITPHAILRTENGEGVAALAFSSDGMFLLSGDEEGQVQCWDLERKLVIASFQLPGPTRVVAFVSENRSVVGVDTAGDVTVFSLLGGKVLTSFKTKSRPDQVALDAGRRYLAAATKNGSIEIYDLEAQMPLGTIDARGKVDDLLFLGFDRLGQQLVAVTRAGKVACWNPATQRLDREIALQAGELHGSKSVIQAAATNRAANNFVISLQEVALPKGGLKGQTRPGDLARRNMVIAYDWNTGTEIKRVQTGWRIDRIALGPGNDHVATMSDESTSITLMDLRRGEIGSSVEMPEQPLVLAVADDDAWLAAGSRKGEVSVWKLQLREGATTAARSVSRPGLSGRIRAPSGEEPALSPGAPVTLALLTFEAKGLSQDIADVCLEVMSSSLANVPYVTLVERTRIKDVVEELKLQMTGLTEQNGAEVGKMLNADLVLLGSVGTLGTSYIFSARLLEVETGKIIKGRQVICEECRDQDIFDAMNVLVSTIAR